MNIREISKPVTASALNESLAKRFGTRIRLEDFTLEQLEDVRNKLRTKLSQVETNESYDAVHTSESYQKNKLFLDVLNAEITERENIDEAKKPDADGDGVPDWADKKPGKDDNAGKKKGGKKGMSDKQKKYFGKKNESIVREGAEDQAELVMAAKDMVDRVTSWMEDTAEMQTESMLELADAIRDEMGNEQSEAFVAAVKPALESLYAAMESTRGALTGGVGLLTGEGAPAEEMGTDDEMAEPEMEPTIDAEDEFATAEPAAGGEEEAGRAQRESVESKKRVIESSRRLATILSKKK